MPAQFRRHDADDAPVVLAAHREEQVEARAPEIDVDLVRHHRAGHLDVGDEEDVLVGRAGEVDVDSLRTALRAPSQPAI